MRILVTGGTGLLGKGLIETCPAEHVLLVLHRNPLCVVEPPTSELFGDVLDRDTLGKIFCTQEFDVVIHAAGLSSVDYVERHFNEAFQSNITGTANLVECCNQFNKHLIYVSTNAVFDGTRAPYREGNPTWPINAYGRIKVHCEELVVKGARSYSIVRPILMYGWPYPAGRQNPVTWLLDKLSHGASVSIVTDVYENPLFYLQCGAALWKLIHRPDIKLVHLAGGEVVNRYEFALVVAREFGLDAGLIKAVGSDFFPDLAPRPRNTSFVTDLMEKELGVMPLTLEAGLKAMAAHRSSGVGS